MPPSLPQALEAEVKRQGVPAEQIQQLELDQKCRAAAIQGLERFTNLVTLSLGSVNLTSLTNFPQLPKLQNLLLSDNKIAGGLEALTAAKLDQLTELDLSNNKFASLPSFKPLAGLRSLKAVHVEANPAEKTVKDLRQSLFKMMAALQYVDNVDPFGKERPAFEEDDDAEDVYEEEVDADDDDGEDAEGEDVDDDEDDAGDEGETFEEEGEGGGAGGGPHPGGGFGNEEDDEDDDEEDGEEEEEVDEFEEEDDEDEEEEPTLGTAYLVGVIPPDVEDDEEEYEDEEDAASEDFDEEEDEEPVGGSVAAALQSMKRKRDEEDDEEEDDEEEEEYDDEDE